MVKRMCALVLAAVILMTCAAPVFAEDSPDAQTDSGDIPVGYSDSGAPPIVDGEALPALTATLEPIYPNWSLTAELANPIPCAAVTPYYSFDGISFIAGKRAEYDEEKPFEEIYLEQDMEPMSSFAAGTTDEFWIYLQMEGEQYTGPSQTCKVTRSTDIPQISQEEISKIEAEMELAQTGWRLTVTIPDNVLIGTRAIYSEYSLDGESFLPATDGMGSQIMGGDINVADEPMKSFMEGKFDSFYFRMKIEGEGCNGYSQTFFFERGAQPQPIPEGAEIYAGLPQSSEVKTMRPPSRKGLFNVTVRVGDTADTLLSHLPDELPVRVFLQFRDSDTGREIIEVEDMMYPVEWTLPQGAAQGGTFRGCMEFVPPAGEATLRGMLADYSLPALPRVQMTVPDPDNAGEFIWVDMPFDLAVNVILAEEKLAPQLGLDMWRDSEEEVLSFSLPNKPSGAKSIVPEYSIDGGESWQTVDGEDGSDIVELGYAPDRVPKQANYAAPLFFRNDRSPMKEYLADSAKGFLVRLKIDGGVYDGVSEAFSWPGEYDYAPPPYVATDLDGGGGNRGDAGTDNGGNGGERPNPPVTLPPPVVPEEPPVTTPPPEVPEKPPGGSGGTSEAPEKPSGGETPDTSKAPQTLPALPASTVPVTPTAPPVFPSVAPNPPAGTTGSASSTEPTVQIPENPAPVGEPSAEPAAEVLKPVREPDQSAGVSPGAVAAVAVAAVAVAGGTAVIAGGAGTAAAIAGKAAALWQKLLRLITRRP